MGDAFQLDTSGTVPFLTVEGHPDAMAWSDLDAFTQGYIEALFAWWQEQLRTSGKSLDAFTQGYIEALFAWWQEQLRTSGKSSAYIVSCLRYDRLAPEALARIIEDCAEALKDKRTGYYADSALSGRKFWQARQSQFQYWTDAHAYQHRHSFPPLTVSLGDDGKVYLSEQTQEAA